MGTKKINGDTQLNTIAAVGMRTSASASKAQPQRELDRARAAYTIKRVIREPVQHLDRHSEIWVGLQWREVTKEAVYEAKVRMVE
jgi:hypothetical protein